MIYMGSKKRVANQLIDWVRCEGNWYEPFVGGGNVIQHVHAPRVWGADANKYVVALLKHLQAGEDLPYFIPRGEYHDIRDNPDAYPDWYVGWACVGCTFNGKWRGSYADFEWQEARLGAAYALDLTGVELVAQDYKIFDWQQLSKEDVVFCDPPYGATKYSGISFDFTEFMLWLRGISMEARTFVCLNHKPDLPIRRYAQLGLPGKWSTPLFVWEIGC